MIEVRFPDGKIGHIKKSTFDWIAQIGRSSFNPDYWKWADSLKKCKKITVHMNRFTWHIYCAAECGEVLQQKDGQEVYCAVTLREFLEIKSCADAKLKNKPDIPPEITNTLTSRPVLFIVNGIRYAGYYHVNGFFYVSDDKKYEKPIFYARHINTKKAPFSGPSLDTVPVISSWEYI